MGVVMVAEVMVADLVAEDWGEGEKEEGTEVVEQEEDLAVVDWAVDLVVVERGEDLAEAGLVAD